MHRIVPLVASLQEHLDRLAEKAEDYRPAGCPSCGLGRPWCHGHYERKADRDGGRLNPIPVPRYVCRRKGGVREELLEAAELPAPEALVPVESPDGGTGVSALGHVA
ncbi:hypothetical protein B2A_00083 [mine drainage metagenome]|uniref:Uncharacterized protein n=1 Tax=mine drainage metagenome TaxID=410659 RepID=T1B908_9ZZZZ